jgi:mono/diheme cytochrome c family protein
MSGRIKYLQLALLAALMLVGCTRERPSTRAPIHLIPDMDNQPRVNAQEMNAFFEDSSGMRLPVPGTVARGWLREDAAYYTGKDPQSGEPILSSPVPVTLTGLERGRERFDIYCSVCHSRVGDGQGIMLQHGYVPPPTFHSDLIREYPDGHIFDVITHGVRNMPGYNQQIPAEDRWLIINYLRALQRSQHASVEDVPEEVLETSK